MKKQKLGGILSIKKNVVSRLNANDVNAGAAMGGSVSITLCASCSQEECCHDGPAPTQDGSSWCRCK